ncbi:MAG: crossover junction endodeoxyribonuclease RuvC [Myxococcota bacterium]|nr:crossover junction endodeoxyribonuclease RuvC [Myxococcota bacterium]
MAEPPHRILGIDPGTRLCGWGIVDRHGAQITHVDNGVIVLDSRTALDQRLGCLMQRLKEIIDSHRPNSVAVEGVFQHRNARSALILGHARGVALAVAASYNLNVFEYAARQVKKAVTGSGTAQKAQIQQMVALRANLDDVPQEDAADAIAIALCHAQANPDIPHEIRAKPGRRRGKKASRAALAALAEQQQRQRR